MHHRSLSTGLRPYSFSRRSSRGYTGPYRETGRLQCRRPLTIRVVRAAQENYYEILGVPRNAELKQIKQAFKKKALKLHPDVNNAPDAKDKFMECKRAYQALSDTKQRSRYDREQSGGGSMDGFKWEDVVSGGAKSRQAAEEAFYGFGDFFRDLDKDRRERQKRKGKEQPMSLWDEISDIGEEFVEFLEKETGLSSAEVRGKARASTQESSDTASAQAQRQSQEAEQRAQKARATAEQGAKKINDDVEEMLQQMKRDLGIK